MNSCLCSWTPTHARVGEGGESQGANPTKSLALSFAANHDLSLVNTFFRTPKGGMSYTFNGRGKKRIDYILTRQRDRKLVGNVTVHRQPSLHPMSDHNVVSAPVKLLDNFSRNRRCNTAVKSTIDRQRLTIDPDLRKEVADAIGNFLRVNPPSGSRRHGICLH